MLPTTCWGGRDTPLPPKTYLPGVRALWVHLPGIAKVYGVFLHLEVAAGKVVVLDTVKIPTQPTHLLLDGQGARVSPGNLRGHPLRFREEEAPASRGYRGRSKRKSEGEREEEHRTGVSSGSLPSPWPSRF